MRGALCLSAGGQAMRGAPRPAPLVQAELPQGALCAGPGHPDCLASPRRQLGWTLLPHGTQRPRRSPTSSQWQTHEVGKEQVEPAVPINLGRARTLGSGGAGPVVSPRFGSRSPGFSGGRVWPCLISSLLLEASAFPDRSVIQRRGREGCRRGLLATTRTRSQLAPPWGPGGVSARWPGSRRQRPPWASHRLRSPGPLPFVSPGPLPPLCGHLRPPAPASSVPCGSGRQAKR